MENIKESLEGLISAMQKAGIVSIVADYGGYGDNWDGMGSLTAIDGNNKKVYQCPLSVQRAAEDFVVEVVDTYHAGFENNDGGRGTVTIDLLAREVRIEHIYLGVESDTTERLIAAEEDEDLAALFQEHAPVEINERSRYARMRFEGYGDSGQMEECDPAARPFEDWGYTVLENELPGWEVAEGGGAEFMIDFQERRVRASIWSNMEVEGDPIVHTLSFDEVLRAPSGEAQAA